MIKYYEGKISELQKQNQDSIDKLLREFKLNLLKVQEEYQDSKKTAKNLEEIYEKKLDQQENEHEDEIFEIKEKHKKDKTQLEKDWAELQEIQKQLKTNKKMLENEREAAENLMINAKKRKKENKLKLEEKIKQIKMLE